MPPERLDCAAVDELLHAYATDMLDEEEYALVEEHLAGCSLHDDVAAWSQVAVRMTDLAPAIAPPSGLRDRILAIPAAVAAAEAHDVAPPLRAGRR